MLNDTGMSDYWKNPLRAVAKPIRENMFEKSGGGKSTKKKEH